MLSSFLINSEVSLLHSAEQKTIRFQQPAQFTFSIAITRSDIWQVKCKAEHKYITSKWMGVQFKTSLWMDLCLPIPVIKKIGGFIHNNLLVNANFSKSPSSFRQQHNPTNKTILNIDFLSCKNKLGSITCYASLFSLFILSINCFDIFISSPWCFNENAILNPLIFDQAMFFNLLFQIKWNNVPYFPYINRRPQNIRDFDRL